MSPIRNVAAGVMALIGGMALNGGVTTALNVFTDYKDSPDTTYLTFGAFFALMGVGAVALAVLTALAGTPTEGRSRRRAGILLLAVAGASFPAAFAFANELSEIANDPEAEAGNAAGAALSIALGAAALAFGAWQLHSGSGPKRMPRSIAASALTLAMAGIATIYLVLPPTDAERLSGAAALAEHRAVGCSEQDGGWFYCRAQGPKNGTKDYVVTFDGECWVTMAPKVRDGKIVSLDEIHDGCLKRRGVGRTRPGPGEAPPAIADAASRFLPASAR